MNLLGDLPVGGAGETVERLASGQGVRIERIVSRGEASPGGFWYDQDEAEFVVVLSGAARLRFADGEVRTLEPGDGIGIPAHRRHRVDWTAPEQPTVWLAVFYQPDRSGTRDDNRGEDFMPPQLPRSGETFLDHVAHFVPAMEPAAEALERCGFRLTPFTVQTNREGGATVPSGTGNRCAMLRNGYVEILVATSDSPLSRQLAERIADHVGLHLAAFATADAGAEHARLAAAGFATLPLVDMRRSVTLDGATDDARFTIARIAHGSMPEGRTQFLAHHTESLVWRTDYLDHPNGAVALNALWLAADDPQEAAERFARFTGRPAQPRGEVMTVRLDRGALHAATPAFLTARLGIVPAGTPPCFVATTLLVENLGRLKDCLDRGGVAHRPITLPGGNAAVAVALPAPVGDTMIFREA